MSDFDFSQFLIDINNPLTRSNRKY